MNSYFSMRVFYNDQLQGKFNIEQQEKLHQIKSPVFPDRKIKKVPVLRLFGITKRGQKACLNIFDYYPFLYCEFPVQIFNIERSTSEELQVFLSDFAFNLEFALYLSIYQKSGLKSPRILLREFEDKNEQLVHNCELAYKYPIYGYYTEKKPFIKIELYHSIHVKKCANMLYSGILYGIAMQPYEAHLSYHMHFYGDYGISGLDFIKVMDVMIRNLESFDEEKRELILKRKSFYSLIFSEISGEGKVIWDEEFKQNSRRQSAMSIRKSQQSLKNQLQNIVNQQNCKDYTFLHDDINLKLWHSEMTELSEQGKNIDSLLSPYQRMSSCEIELDCNCRDILNIWENDQNLLGSMIGRSNNNDEALKLRSQDVEENKKQNHRASGQSNVSISSSFIDNAMDKLLGEVQEPTYQRHSYSQESMKFQDEDLLMKIYIDQQKKQQTQQQISDYSESRLLSDFSNTSFQLNQINLTPLELSPNSKSVDQQQVQQQTPDFKLNQIHQIKEVLQTPLQSENLDQQFTKYSQDIKYVRSLVNLWKEEFIRRKHQGLPDMERAQMSDDTRTGGYSQSLNDQERVQNFLLKHLRTKAQNVQSFNSVDCELYKQLEKIDFEALSIFIQQKEELNDETDMQERFQMLGFFNMRQMQDDRHTRALQKNLQHTLNSGIDDPTQAAAADQEDELEVLDIMESLKDQYENIKQRREDHKTTKAKYKTGKIGNDLQNNKSIFDYMSPTRNTKKMGDTEMEDECEINEEPSSFNLNGADLDNILNGLSDNESNYEQINVNDQEDEIDSIEQSLLGIQTSDLKQKLLKQSNFQLEEVKEEDENSQDESINWAQMESLINSELNQVISNQGEESQGMNAISNRNMDVEMINEEQKEQIVEYQPRHILKGDKIVRVRSPKRKQPNDINHQLAYFSKKGDLIEHLQHAKQIRFMTLCILFLMNKQLSLKEGHQLLNQKRNMLKNKQKMKVDIDQDLKLQAKREMIGNISSSSGPNRFITPATQYALKNLDSQQNVGGFERMRDQGLQDNPNETLFDIHQEFQLINGITVLYLEVMVCNRMGCAVFFVLHNECAQLDLGANYRKVHGVIINKQQSKQIKAPENSGTYQPINYHLIAKNEVNLLQKVIELFREFDPDIIVGHETEAMSIGYICKRAEQIGIQMSNLLSRTPMTLKPLNESFYNQKLLKESKLHHQSVDDQMDQDEALRQQNQGSVNEKKKKMGVFYQKFGQQVKLNGRIIINLWSVLRNEINLTNYDLENSCFHILKKREPRFDYDMLTMWWQRGQFSHVANYLIKRLLNIEAILDTLDLINRDINMAKVYGIDYESIMTRGSQFRVESLLSKITKSQDFLLLSASVQQVRQQNELEVIPLVIEPDKQFYTSPVDIVDFQSLYPSVIIAYNLCYSTCLGKIIQINPESTSNKRKLGVYNIPANIKSFFGIENDQDLTEEQEQYILDSIIIAPNLNCFVKPHLRLGLLPRMLREILYTRIMVKKSMKLYKPGSTIYRMLDSRQLALKLIANVTYGYTAAGFSGRMPCSEFADSVVSISRQTLEKCMKIVNQNEDNWGTKVIYGDTDSTFILCEGKTLEKAFEIGELIAKTVTSINPFPMELKFEKVYYPCVTLAKKRYCGYKMEKITDKPSLDAKGIETIRRDTVDAVQKIMDKCLRLLFETKDLSQVKDYLIRQWTKIQNGDVEFKDFIFAKEVRFGSYRTLPPSAIICERRLERDPGAMPRYKERIPYVIAMGQGGAIDQSKIKDLVLSPEEFLSSDGLMLNAPYYIKRQINAAINRIFLEIFDIDVNQWYIKMPKKTKEHGVFSKRIDYFNRQISSAKSTISKSIFSGSALGSKTSVRSGASSSSSIAGQNSMMIDQFYNRKSCIVCSESSLVKLCKQCSKNIRETVYILNQRLQNLQNKIDKINLVCLACSNMLLRGRVAALVDHSMNDDGISNEIVPCINYQCKIFYDKIALSKEYWYLKDVIKTLNLSYY
eukprot:403359875